jgi:hypothetical protein
MKKGETKSWSLLWEFGRQFFFWFLVQNVKKEEGIRRRWGVERLHVGLVGHSGGHLVDRRGEGTQLHLLK